MIRFHILLSTFFLSGILFGQQPANSESPAARPTCAELLTTASLRIPALDARGEITQAWVILNSWSEECPGSQIQTYTRAVIQLRRDGKITTDQPAIFMDQLLDAPVDIESAASGDRRRGWNNDEVIQLNTDERALLAYVYRTCTDLALRFEPGTLEYFTCKVLSGERQEAIQSLRKEPIASSAFARRFAQRRKNLYTFSAMHLQLRGGVWNGLDRTADIGQLTTMGGSMGGNFLNGDIMDVSFDAWVGGAPAQPVMISFLDTVRTTDFVSGIYTALEYDKAIWRHRNYRHRIGLRGGVGYSHLNLVPERYRGNQTFNNNGNNTVTIRYRKYVGSFTGSVALNYSYSLNPSVYISAQGRYFFNDFRNTGGTDIRGGNWSATVGFGFYMGTDMRGESKRLGMKL